MWRAIAVVLAVAGCQRPSPTPPGFNQPESRPAATVAPARPMTFENGVPVIVVDHWYWCFATKRGVDLCAATKELCEHWMGQLGTGSGCVPAPQSACFHTAKTGDQPDFGMCFRTPDDCKTSAELWAADPKAAPIAIGCTVFRAENSPPSPAPAAGDRRVIRIAQPLFCYLETNLEDGECRATLAECEASRAGHAAMAAVEVSQCEPLPAAACFDATDRVSGNVVRSCYVSLSLCERLIASMSTKPDWQFPSLRCYVVRLNTLP